jgi:signal transduction histidine kinase
MRRFTANASHELRTPLSALHASGQAALAGPDDPDQLREALGEMLEDAEQLGRLLNAMLLLAQADAGTVTIDRRPVVLGELVADVASECEVLALEKQQRLRLDAEPGLAAVDRDVFRIAVANILHNAIRYGHPSTLVEVRTYRMDSTWIVEVSDSGPGIAPEHHSRLFERFYRVDAGRSRTVGGVGLGLAMARWSVEQHGGRIELESQIGIGSTFRVVMPDVTPS